MRRYTQVTLTGGVIAGFIGYLSTVILFALFNVVTGKSAFYTAAILGNALFYGATGASVVAPGPVLSYNAVHLIAFMLFGLMASWLASMAERFPVAQYVFFFILIFVGFHVYFGLTVFAMPLLGSSTWWEIGIPSAVAAILMGWYLLRTHPVLRSELKELQWGEVPFDEETGH